MFEKVRKELTYKVRQMILTCRKKLVPVFRKKYENRFIWCKKFEFWDTISREEMRRGGESRESKEE